MPYPEDITTVETIEEFKQAVEQFMIDHEQTSDLTIDEILDLPTEGSLEDRLIPLPDDGQYMTDEDIEEYEAQWRSRRETKNINQALG